MSRTIGDFEVQVSLGSGVIGRSLVSNDPKMESIRIESTRSGDVGSLSPSYRNRGGNWFNIHVKSLNGNYPVSGRRFVYFCIRWDICICLKLLVSGEHHNVHFMSPARDTKTLSQLTYYTNLFRHRRRWGHLYAMHATRLHWIRAVMDRTSAHWSPGRWIADPTFRTEDASLSY